MVFQASVKASVGTSLLQGGVGVLQELFKSEDSEVRAKALVGLCKTGSAGIFSPFERNVISDLFRVFPIIAPPPWNCSPPLWYNYHDWGGAIGYLTTKLGGGGYNGKDPLFLPCPSTCHYIANRYVIIWHVVSGCVNNMYPLSFGGGGGANGEDP